jgi:hypothetical protein
MDAHDTGEAPPSAPRFDGDIELSAAVNGGNEQSHDHRQGPTVNQLCHTFFDHLKVCDYSHYLPEACRKTHLPSSLLHYLIPKASVWRGIP